MDTIELAPSTSKDDTTSVIVLKPVTKQNSMKHFICSTLCNR